MGLPKFTGEASLYRSGAYYQTALWVGESPLGRAALPQQEAFSPLFGFCSPPVCIPGRSQHCCYPTPLGWRCWTRYCPPPDPCAHCRTPAECCVCNGGTWTGKVCI